MDRKQALLQATGAEGADASTVFMFQGDAIFDLSPRAERFLAASTVQGSDWQRLSHLLTKRFPGFDDKIEGLDDFGRIELPSQDGESELIAEASGDTVRITIEDLDVETTTVELDQASFFELEGELETLRAVVEETPFLVWRQTRDGTVTWANRTYLEAVRHHTDGDDIRWPPKALFNQKALEQAYTHSAAKRIALNREPKRSQRWYEVHSAPVGDEFLFSAVDVNATVRAENQLREFMQTLTKTFAHLTVGLAVFDRARRLALFNPALGELTELPIDFLTARPTLVGFLDRLRDIQMIPEPKDYKAWRRKMAELEAATANGTYSETWSLPSGQTYRVTGRPHPGGAVAFLFEDISAEMSLTRRFRSELDLGQAVLNSLDEAIAVFAQGGTLALSNKAYTEIWNLDPDTTVEDLTIIEATRTWMAACAPTPVWGELRDFVTQSRDRESWSADIRLSDGRGLACRFVPLPGGYTLVGFSELGPVSATMDTRKEIA
ncbi:MAG: diguanylate cyclase [Rhodobacteraceae bacterium]|nr:diguanylate cyclase [Paracoccaceae bacterium]